MAFKVPEIAAWCVAAVPFGAPAMRGARRRCGRFVQAGDGGPALAFLAWSYWARGANG